MASLRKPVSPEAARLRMAGLCARSEQCAYDIRQKLFKMGIPNDTASGIIEYLTENRFIDDSRFAYSFAADKARFSAWGRNKIKAGLIAKRISSGSISKALDRIDPGIWEEGARRVALAKARSLDISGPQARENKVKIYRHLLSRGFESQIASQAVRNLGTDT